MLRDRGYMVDQADIDEGEKEFVEKVSAQHMKIGCYDVCMLSSFLFLSVLCDAQPRNSNNISTEEG